MSKSTYCTLQVFPPSGWVLGGITIPHCPSTLSKPLDWVASLCLTFQLLCKAIFLSVAAAPLSFLSLRLKVQSWSDIKSILTLCSASICNVLSAMCSLLVFMGSEQESSELFRVAWKTNHSSKQQAASAQPLYSRGLQLPNSLPAGGKRRSYLQSVPGAIHETHNSVDNASYINHITFCSAFCI